MNWQYEKIYSACRSFESLKMKDSIAIINYIGKNEPVCVQKIQKALRIGESWTSQRLRFLRWSQLVTCEREGKKMMYSINYERFERMQKALAHLTERPNRKRPKPKPLGIIDANHLESW